MNCFVYIYDGLTGEKGCVGSVYPQAGTGHLAGYCADNTNHTTLVLFFAKEDPGSEEGHARSRGQLEVGDIMNLHRT